VPNGRVRLASAHDPCLHRDQMGSTRTRFLTLTCAVFIMTLFSACGRSFEESPNTAEPPTLSAAPPTKAPSRTNPPRTQPTRTNAGTSRPPAPNRPTATTGTREPTPSEPAPSQSPTPTEGSNPGEGDKDQQAKLSRFRESCRKEAQFYEGQVDYPLTLRMRMGVATTYAAVVDIRENPLPPGEVIDTDNPGSDPIYVQCVVGARLVPVGDDIDVEVVDASDGGWKYQEFTPKGELKWSWSVTARTPAARELRLELRPAARESSAIRNGDTTASYVTKVTVDASTIGRFWYWLQTEGKLLQTIGITLGAAFLGILAFSTRAREGLLKLVRRNPDEKSETEPTDKISDEEAAVTKQVEPDATPTSKNRPKNRGPKKRTGT
jgi:hypothetical protein